MTCSPFFYMHFFPFSRIPAATDTLKKIVKHQNRVYCGILVIGYRLKNTRVFDQGNALIPVLSTLKTPTEDHNQKHQYDFSKNYESS